MENFEKWDKEFRAQNLFKFNHDANGLLWLKVRAVSRGKQLSRFLQENGITLQSRHVAERNRELFVYLEKQNDAVVRLDNFLRSRSNEWYATQEIDEAVLKEDLYKIQHYTWGGDQSNSLDKYLVSRYVKTISSYDELNGKQNEIVRNAWNYVEVSWYNNWTSYLIESLFKNHERVISAVGAIKSVDFFINNYPIDLKVTYFPREYMEMKLRERMGKKELTWLKEKAKDVGIKVDSSFTESQQLYVLTEKLREQGCQNILHQLKTARRAVVSEARDSPVELMTWLYAKQGELRFGAENRLFVILVDAEDMTQSWKMKRAFSLIEPKVNEYLTAFNDKSLKKICFRYKNSHYQSLADTLFIVKE